MPNQPSYLKQVPQPSRGPELKKGPPRPTVKQRLINTRERYRKLLPYAATILATLAVLFVFDAVRPGAPRLTRKDIDTAVEEALAKMPPAPAYNHQRRNRHSNLPFPPRRVSPAFPV